MILKCKVCGKEFEAKRSDAKFCTEKCKKVSKRKREGSFATKICDVCGKEKEVKGGRTCEKGHFICRSHVGVGIFSDGIKQCPICGKPVR